MTCRILRTIQYVPQHVEPRDVDCAAIQLRQGHECRSHVPWLDVGFPSLVCHEVYAFPAHRCPLLEPYAVVMAIVVDRESVTAASSKKLGTNVLTAFFRPFSRLHEL